jgi:hypothetical protein
MKRLENEAWGVQIRLHHIDPADRKQVWFFGFKPVEAIASFQALALYQAHGQAGFPGDLCRCRECKTFFFSSDVSEPGVRPRTDFCTKEHRQEHQRKTGADRKAASRAGITAEEWRQKKLSEGGTNGD